MDKKHKYKIAQKRVEAKIGFFIHAAVYLGVNALLITLNLTSSAKEIWFIYPLVGWGLGLLLHFVLVYWQTPTTGDWQKRMIKKELERLE